jgi:hypothetical protein
MVPPADQVADLHLTALVAVALVLVVLVLQTRALLAEQ